MIGPSLGPVSFTCEVVACSKEKIVFRSRTTYSSLDKPSPDELSRSPPLRNSYETCLSCSRQGCRIIYSTEMKDLDQKILIVKNVSNI